MPADNDTASTPPDLDRLFHPRTVAVIGASDTPGRPATLNWRRVRDWAAATSAMNGNGLTSYITRLNAIRRAHPALQLLRNLRLHQAEDDHVVAWSKRSGSDAVIVVLSLDPHQARESMVHLDLAALGLEPGTSFTVHDELSGSEWTWGEHNYVRLDPAQPAHILTVKEHL